MKRPSEITYQLVYDGGNSSIVRRAVVTSYNSAPLQNTAYYFVVKAINWVGSSEDSAILTVNIQLPISASKSIVSGSGIFSIASMVNSIFTVQLKDSEDNSKITGGEIGSAHV